ncbi:MAG: putative esterase of the alpha-beta hydrolase superfamily [Actinomycetia bacterium]|nr:putative esterase of the alpha-beta hydrolase superfamily [Actinomycetes bacterium]
MPSRIGLVLGAGGVAGGAFHAGVLAALAEATGWDARRSTIIVGTSAGSITGAALRSGLAPADLLADAEGRALSPDGARKMRAGAGRRTPPLTPTPRRAPIGAHVARTLARAAARPFSARPLALLAGLLPEGTVSADLIVNAVGEIAPSAWPNDPLWICAVRERDGKLVVFGRDAAAPLPYAVAASCAIPGYFRPVGIDGERFVDGGAHSPTNADLLNAAALDLVIISSPMSSTGRGVRLAVDQPARRWSRMLLDVEAMRLRRAGIHVIAFQPTAADLAVAGSNPMDPSRRGAIASQARASTLRRLARADTQARLAPLT